MRNYTIELLFLARGKIDKERAKDTENFVRPTFKRPTLDRADETGRIKYEEIMKNRKFLLHSGTRCDILLTEIPRKETTAMRMYATALPDDLDDMIFLDEPWTHSER